jgi:aminoglycoside phosphotransferase (APT) family kinase protein
MRYSQSSMACSPYGFSAIIASLGDSVVDASGSDMSACLLAYLQRALGTPGLGYASRPERFTAGVENRVYGLQLSGATPPFDGALVLRLYGSGSEGVRARLEATIQAEVCKQGFPAPRPMHVCEDEAVLGAPFFIMEHLPGHIMLEPIANVGAGLAAPLLNWRGLLRRMPGVIADLMASLHDLDPEPVRQALTAAGIDP